MSIIIDGLFEANQIAKKRNWTCKATEYISSSTKMPFHCNICECNWKVSLNSIKDGPNRKGTGCPQCAGKIFDGLAEIKQISKGRNWKCSATVYINSKTKISWHCNVCECDWEASLANVKGTKSNKGTGCPRCAGHEKLDGLTISHQIAKEKNWECRSAIYVNSQTPMPWHCNIDGCDWKACLGSIKGTLKRKGSGCPRCAGTEKLDGLIEAQQIAASKIGECRATVYINNMTPMPFHCNICGCNWEAPLSRIKGTKNREGAWCPDCAHNCGSNGLKAALQIAEERNWTCKATKYIDQNTPMPWICNICDHEWERDLNHAKRSTGCEGCTGIEECMAGLKIAQKIAIERNGKCNAIIYIDSNTPMPFSCNICGHEWMATLSNIKHKESWCPECADERLRLIDGLKIANLVAEERNWICMATEYKNVVTPILWFCKACENKWMACLHSVTTNETGCPSPQCKGRKSQALLGSHLHTLFPDHKIDAEYHDFFWQATIGPGRLSLDYYIHGLKAGIEYDGEGHFFPVDFGGMGEEKARKAFEDTKRRDELKNQRVKEHPEDVAIFIRIPYTEPLTLENVKRILEENGIKVPR